MTELDKALFTNKAKSYRKAKKLWKDDIKTLNWVPHEDTKSRHFDVCISSAQEFYWGTGKQWSEWPRGLRCRSAAARLLRSWVSNPTGCTDVCLL